VAWLVISFPSAPTLFMTSVMLGPDCEYVLVSLLGAGPGVNLDFETLSCQVPITGSAAAASAIATPLVATTIARTARTSSFLMFVPRYSMMLSDSPPTIFEWTRHLPACARMFPRTRPCHVGCVTPAVHPQLAALGLRSRDVPTTPIDPSVDRALPSRKYSPIAFGRCCGAAGVARRSAGRARGQEGIGLSGHGLCKLF